MCIEACSVGVGSPLDWRRTVVSLALGWGLALGVPAVSAKPLYLQAVEQAVVDAETLEKARRKVKAHKDLVIRDDIDAKLPPFHRRLKRKVTRGETFCQGCHLPLPHQKHLRTRAFMNMHSRFIACATCHFRPEGRRLVFHWLDYRTGRVVRGNPERFRIGREVSNDVPIDGWVKIAPFWRDEAVVPLPNDPEARRILKQWRTGGLAERARLQARLHLPLEKKGPECQACHREDAPYLDLEALGAGPEQARLVYRHMIPRFFSQYQREDQRIRIIDLTR